MPPVWGGGEAGRCRPHESSLRQQEHDAPYEEGPQGALPGGGGEPGTI